MNIVMINSEFILMMGVILKLSIEIYPNFSFSDLAWADFDTDGDYDFVVCGMKFTYQTSIYQNQGNNFL